jgi:cell division initiation protein
MRRRWKQVGDTAGLQVVPFRPMAISPQTLREVEFRSSLRGYHPDDVDEFLERLADGIEELHARIRATTEHAVRIEQARLAEAAPHDENMRELLTRSQEEADAALDAARLAAERLRATAAAYADALAAEVHGSVERTRAQARTHLEADLRRLEDSRRHLLAEISAAERLTLAAGVHPPVRPRWPDCLLVLEQRFPEPSTP